MTGVIIEPFAGPGGTDEGARLLGIHNITGIDNSRDACTTAQAAGHTRIRADIQTMTDQQIKELAPNGCDGVIASPTCRPYSNAGKRLGLLDIPAITLHIQRCTTAGMWIDYPNRGWHDPRSPLVLEPLRFIYILNPTWVMLEQVPAAQPLWDQYAAAMQPLGYHIWTGVLSAERYGVGQTRRRSIYLAHKDRAVSKPPPTHEAYEPDPDEWEQPGLFDSPLLPCRSQIDVLGWGMTGRPSYTVTGGGTETGGAEPFGNTARQGMRKEQGGGRWVPRIPAVKRSRND